MVKCSIRTYRRLKGNTKVVWMNYTHSGRNLTPKGTTKKRAQKQKENIWKAYDDGSNVVRCPKGFRKN